MTLGSMLIGVEGTRPARSFYNLACPAVNIPITLFCEFPALLADKEVAPLGSRRTATGLAESEGKRSRARAVRAVQGSSTGEYFTSPWSVGLFCPEVLRHCAPVRCEAKREHGREERIRLALCRASPGRKDAGFVWKKHATRRPKPGAEEITRPPGREKVEICGGLDKCYTRCDNDSMKKWECPLHGQMSSAMTQWGLRWQCSAPGCTVACWDGSTSSPADNETRKLRDECGGSPSASTRTSG
jgi:hypothetical protein